MLSLIQKRTGLFWRPVLAVLLTLVTGYLLAQNAPPNIKGVWVGRTDNNQTAIDLNILYEDEKGVIRCSLSNEGCHGGVSPCLDGESGEYTGTIWIETDHTQGDNYKRLCGQLSGQLIRGDTYMTGRWSSYENNQPNRQGFKLYKQTPVTPPN